MSFSGRDHGAQLDLVGVTAGEHPVPRDPAPNRESARRDAGPAEAPPVRRLQLSLPVVSERTPGMPATRGECAGVQRPCPFVRCRYHLWLVTDRAGHRQYPGYHPPNVVRRFSEESCALDVAERGGIDDRAIAKVLGKSRGLVRKVAAASLKKLKDGMTKEHGPEKCEDGCEVCDSYGREEESEMPEPTTNYDAMTLEQIIASGGDEP